MKCVNANSNFVYCCPAAAYDILRVSERNGTIGTYFFELKKFEKRKMLKNPVSISNFHNLITCPFKTQHRFRSRLIKHVFTLLSCFSARPTSPKTEETWDVLLIQPTYPPNAPITSSIFSDIFLISLS